MTDKLRPSSFRALVKSDIAAFARRAGRTGGYGYALRYLSLSPGFLFVLGLRMQRAIVSVPIIGKPLRRLFWFAQSVVFGSEVSVDASVGEGFYTPHPYGIVVGDGAVIGRDVSILQGVTIGIKSPSDRAIGIIADEVFLGAGAAIIGAVTVGRGAVVGANAVVIRDVPAGATVVGNPARILPARGDAL